MNSAQPSFEFLRAIAADTLITLATPKIGLFTGTPTLNKDTVLSDLVALAPNYPGYAEVALVAGTKRVNANGDRIQPYTHAGFVPISPLVDPAPVITGYYVQSTEDATEILRFSETLDTPFVFNDDLTALNLIIEVLTRNDRVWGGYVAQY